MSVSIAYNLTGCGWSECTLVIDEHRAFVTASYLSDALGDLLTAIIRIVKGEPEAPVSFAEEPGEYRWRFFRLEPDRLRVRILEISGPFENGPDEKGEVIFDAECRLRTFAAALLSESQRLLEQHGLEGYLGLWVNYEFPLDRQEELRCLLREAKE